MPGGMYDAFSILPKTENSFDHKNNFETNMNKLLAYLTIAQTSSFSLLSLFDSVPSSGCLTACGKKRI